MFRKMIPSTNNFGSIVYRDKMNGQTIVLTDDILSKHVLVLGEHGSGKTNIICTSLPQVDTTHHKALIFDPKGDYKNEFFNKDTDIVLSGSIKDKDVLSYWNIFREIEFSSEYMIEKLETLKEIVSCIFEGHENDSQPFFSNAAEDLFSMNIEKQMLILWNKPEYKLLQAIIEKSGSKKDRKASLEKQRQLFEELVDTELNNKRLDEIMSNASLNYYRNRLGKDFPRVYGYLGEQMDKTYTTGLSVIGEMQATYNTIFKHTMFAEYEKGKDIAISDFVKHKTGRLFIEYSMSASKSLEPIYTLLCDMAIKIQLDSFNETKTNLYLFLDEMKMAPKMSFLQDGLNYGRSLGCRIIGGIQSIEQLYEAYGEYTARVLMESFSSIIVMQLNAAAESRRYAIDRIAQHGSYVTRPTGNQMSNVDEKNILQLQCGEAIVKLYGYLYPICFSFERYRG